MKIGSPPKKIIAITRELVDIYYTTKKGPSFGFNLYTDKNSLKAFLHVFNQYHHVNG
jgi:hypothetical protein